MELVREQICHLLKAADAAETKCGDVQLTPQGARNIVETDALLRQKCLEMEKERDAALKHVDTYKKEFTEYANNQMAQRDERIKALEKERDRLLENLSLCKGNELAARVDVLEGALKVATQISHTHEDTIGEMEKALAFVLLEYKDHSDGDEGCILANDKDHQIWKMCKSALAHLTEG